jgi:hypothetical protein
MMQVIPQHAMKAAILDTGALYSKSGDRAAACGRSWDATFYYGVRH